MLQKQFLISCASPFNHRTFFVHSSGGDGVPGGVNVEDVKQRGGAVGGVDGGPDAGVVKVDGGFGSNSGVEAEQESKKAIEVK